jgi:membrane protein
MKANDLRGREARWPHQVSPRGWRDIVWRIYSEVRHDRLDLLAATIAFWGLFSLFPTLIALVSFYGLVADPIEVERQLSGWVAGLPPGAREVVQDQLYDLVRTPASALGVGFVVSVVGALWAASSGMKALLTGINIAYDEEERRGFFRLRLTAMGLMVLMIAMGLAYLALVAVIPALFDVIGLDRFGRRLVTIGRWPVLAVASITLLSIVYRHGPCRRDARWRWLTLGAALATALMLVATWLTTFYVDRFASYHKTYGALGGVVVLMLWLYVTSFMVLVGAEINAETEAQTKKDSTVGPDKPMGMRGAVKADRLGESFARHRNGSRAAT